MKIKPLSSYDAPAYPTIGETRADARLLERRPSTMRGRGHAGSVASLLGAGIFIQITGTSCGADAEPRDVKIDIVDFADRAPGDGTNAVEKTAAKKIATTRVAPLLEEALANDGRGFFGCVATAAPVYLSEDDAMDLIKTELEKVGLKLKRSVEIDGLQIPDSSTKQKARPGNDIDLDEDEKPRIKNLVEGSYTFDLGTEDKSVVVKFLSWDDFSKWKNEPSGPKFSITSYDFAWLAAQVRDSFSRRAAGEPVVIGLFFEPVVYPGSSDEFVNQGLTMMQERFATEQFLAVQTNAQTPEELAIEKLRRQVLHFVEYLQKEGIAERAE